MSATLPRGRATASHKDPHAYGNASRLNAVTRPRLAVEDYASDAEAEPGAMFAGNAAPARLGLGLCCLLFAGMLCQGCGRLIGRANLHIHTALGWESALLEPGALDLKSAPYLVAIKPGRYRVVLRGRDRVEVPIEIRGASPYLFVLDKAPYVYENEYVTILR